MKDVKLVLSVVAIETPDGKDSKVVYQTEKIFSGEQVEAATEGQLVGRVITDAANGVASKPTSVSPFKADLVEDEPKKETPPPPPAEPKGEGTKAAKKKSSKTVVKKKAAKKKSGRGK